MLNDGKRSGWRQRRILGEEASGRADNTMMPCAVGPSVASTAACCQTKRPLVDHDSIAAHHGHSSLPTQFAPTKELNFARLFAASGSLCPEILFSLN